MPVIVKGGQFFDISDKELAKQQQQVQPEPIGPTTMVDPDGKVVVIPADQYNAAINKGLRDATEDEMQKEERILAGAKHQEEYGGPINTFGRNFINEASFGLTEHKPDDMSQDDWDLQQEINKRQDVAHSTAATSGKVGGFIAPLLIPGVGEVGDAAKGLVEGGTKLAADSALEAGAKELGTSIVKQEAKTSLARKIVGSATKYATEGAIYSAPDAMVKASYGDEEGAAETMLWGVGLNAVLGGAGRLVGEGLGAGGRAIKNIASDTLTKTSDNGLTKIDDIARNVLGITDKQAKGLGSARVAKIVDIADKEGILSMSPSERPAAIKALLQDSGTKLGDHYELLENSLTNPDNIALMPKATETATKFQDAVMKDFPEIFNEAHASEAKMVDKITKDIFAGGDEPSFKILQEIRKGLPDFPKNESQTVKAQIVRLADTLIKRDIENGAQAIYHSGQLPEEFADYLHQKARYSSALELQKNVNPFKGTGRLPQIGLKSLGLGALALSGHPLAVGGEVALDAFMKNKAGLLGKGVSFLRKAAKDPNAIPLIGGLMAKEGANAFINHLKSIPSILDGSKIITRSVASLSPVSHILGDTTGLSKDTQYDRLTLAIKKATVDTDLTATNVGAISGTFTGTSTSLASLVAQKKFGALNYLATQIPKGPSPQPFQRDEWKPSKQQQAEFLQKVSIVNDPMTVWKNYQDNTLSKIDRDTLKAVYPKIYQQFVDKIIRTAFDPREKPLNYHQRLQLSMFTGVPMDASLKNVYSIQTAVAEAPPQQSQPAQKRTRSPKFDHSSTNMQTDVQRRTYK